MEEVRIKMQRATKASQLMLLLTKFTKEKRRSLETSDRIKLT